MSNRKKGFDAPEIIQAIVPLFVVLAANADNTVVDVLLVAVTGCAVAIVWRYRRQ
ncbi:hypothetical protein OZX62_03495 [Bifidobacterium sp. ESL0690]|uniref:hypothetical protein n=1 Tax=Bifidobacterium sp. ESL0690 TaxID=2983214 RepID=UPI0023F7C861|nr:hypothetical protein [Bifidobacterium sp. ESL0690]WEV47349.1 hypothetical protein OZX62_03495 [Bifidobacterium sp. ESL0690]